MPAKSLLNFLYDFYNGYLEACIVFEKT